MPSGGFQALTADTAETEFKVMGSFWYKKKELSLQIWGAPVGVSIAARPAQRPPERDSPR